MHRDPGWGSPSLSSSGTEYRTLILSSSPLQAMKDLRSLQKWAVYMTPCCRLHLRPPPHYTRSDLKAFSTHSYQLGWGQS